MKILLGFLEAQGGDVYVDGVRLCEENMVAWRDIVGYVAQDVFVMEVSLRENIVFGKNADEVDEQLLHHVIERACLGSLVADLPEGLDTQIKENGASLSGGQRQRVGIARAMYSGAQILFFDEATSALDNETEEEINESIRSLMEDDLTILVIAHRYSSLKYCNRIYELSEGSITRELSYNELV
jgi:ABC-type multidrug transport system fused ATPase/permease subunit